MPVTSGDNPVCLHHISVCVVRARIVRPHPQQLGRLRESQKAGFLTSWRHGGMGCYMSVARAMHQLPVDMLASVLFA